MRIWLCPSRNRRELLLPELNVPTDSLILKMLVPKYILDYKAQLEYYTFALCGPVPACYICEQFLLENQFNCENTASSY